MTVTVGGLTENLDGMGEEDGMKRGGEAGMELAGFKPILSLLALFVILHQLHTIVVGLGVSVGLGVAVEEGDEIATTLECVFCLGKWVIVG